MCNIRRVIPFNTDFRVAARITKNASRDRSSAKSPTDAANVDRCIYARVSIDRPRPVESQQRQRLRLVSDGKVSPTGRVKRLYRVLHQRFHDGLQGGPRTDSQSAVTWSRRKTF